MKIPYVKAHGARNDFLLSWEDDVPPGDRSATARAICDRHSGVGADGWLLVTPAPAITLYNSDGSFAELSGNGTRCAAAFLFEEGFEGPDIRIQTAAGEKHLRLLHRDGHRFELEMNMGQPVIADGELHVHLPLRGGSHDATLLWVGNPQCAVFVSDFSLDWRGLGAEIESHPRFPNRTNVSFVCPVDEHTIDVRFYERGAGETMSSGTGSTGAAAAAIARGLVRPPVQVLTPAGPLNLRWDGSLFLTGPAEMIAKGEFYL
jgi:diaminopimelate epimerase